MIRSASRSSAEEKDKLESEFKLKMGMSLRSNKRARDSLQSLLSDPRHSIETRYPLNEQGWKYELNMDFNDSSEAKEAETQKS